MDYDNTSVPSWGDQLTAALSGYLSRRMDVSLENALGQLGTVSRAGTQNPITNSPEPGLSVGANGLNIGPTVLLFAAGAALLFFVLKKG